MSNAILNSVRFRIRFTHAAILHVTEDLTNEQFTWLPGPEAPPIGWHLWHIARWADRVQTTMPERNSGPRRQIWEIEELTNRYELDAKKLGVVGCGEGMAHEDAAQIPQAVGKENILGYARRAFSALEEAVDELTPEELDFVRPNCRPFTVNEQKQVVPAPPKDSSVFDDLTFHISHASRHLGMIEALRGAMKMDGTATV